jgi:uncharacterized protein (DUF2164 family)
MRVRLTDERRARTLRSVKKFYAEALDQELSDFAAARILDFLATKLDDLDVEFYEPDEPHSPR